MQTVVLWVERAGRRKAEVRWEYLGDLDPRVARKEVETRTARLRDLGFDYTATDTSGAGLRLSVLAWADPKVGNPYLTQPGTGCWCIRAGHPGCGKPRGRAYLCGYCRLWQCRHNVRAGKALRARWARDMMRMTPEGRRALLLERTKGALPLSQQQVRAGVKGWQVGRVPGWVAGQQGGAT